MPSVFVGLMDVGLIFPLIVSEKNTVFVWCMRLFAFEPKQWNAVVEYGGRHRQ